LKIATPSSVKHFLPVLIDCGSSHRDDKIFFESIEDYFRYRRDNFGAKPAFFPHHMHLNIPDEALFCPVIKDLEDLTCEMIAIDNVSL